MSSRDAGSIMKDRGNCALRVVAACAALACLAPAMLRGVDTSAPEAAPHDWRYSESAAERRARLYRGMMGRAAAAAEALSGAADVARKIIAQGKGSRAENSVTGVATKTMSADEAARLLSQTGVNPYELVARALERSCLRSLNAIIYDENPVTVFQLAVSSAVDFVKSCADAEDQMHALAIVSAELKFSNDSIAKPECREERLEMMLTNVLSVVSTFGRLGMADADLAKAVKQSRELAEEICRNNPLLCARKDRTSKPIAFCRMARHRVFV